MFEAFKKLGARARTWKTITAEELVRGYVEVAVVVPWSWQWLNERRDYELFAIEALQKEFDDVLRVHRVMPTKKQLKKHGHRIYSYAGIVKENS